MPNSCRISSARFSDFENSSDHGAHLRLSHIFLDYTFDIHDVGSVIL